MCFCFRFMYARVKLNPRFSTKCLNTIEADDDFIITIIHTNVKVGNKIANILKYSLYWKQNVGLFNIFIKIKIYQWQFLNSTEGLMKL